MNGALVIIGCLGALLLAGPCHADTAEYGGKSFNYVMPDDYCRLDRSNPADKVLLDLAQEMQGKRNTVLAYYVHCPELEAARARSAIDKFALLLGIGEEGTGAPLELPAMSKEKIIDAVAGSMSKQSAQDILANMAQKVEAFGNKYGSVLKTIGPQIGILEQTKDALYLAVASNIALNGREFSVAGVAGMTPVSNHMVEVALYAPFQGEESYPPLHDQAKSVVSSLIALNAPPVATLPSNVRSLPEASQSSVGGIDWARVAGRGMAGALIALAAYGLRGLFRLKKD